MKKSYKYGLLLAMAACISASSWAGKGDTPGNNGNGQGGCGVGQTTNGCPGNPKPPKPEHPHHPHEPKPPVVVTGPQGPAGPQGPQGEPGVGTPGAPGAAGQNGTNGAPGSNGASAYDVAVQQGFKGTKQEWLDSLKVTGPQGAQGPEGKMANGVAYTAPAGVSYNEYAQTVQGLRDQIDRNNKRAMAGSASAIGIASLVQASNPGESIITVGTGYYGGEGSFAAGVSHQTTEGTTFKGGIGVDTQGGVGLGASVGWKF